MRAVANLVFDDVLIDHLPSGLGIPLQPRVQCLYAEISHGIEGQRDTEAARLTPLRGPTQTEDSLSSHHPVDSYPRPCGTILSVDVALWPSCGGTTSEGLR